jgi:hypothetical protein
VEALEDATAGVSKQAAQRKYRSTPGQRHCGEFESSLFPTVEHAPPTTRIRAMEHLSGREVEERGWGLAFGPVWPLLNTGLSLAVTSA